MFIQTLQNRYIHVINNINPHIIVLVFLLFPNQRVNICYSEKAYYDCIFYGNTNFKK